MEGKFVIASGPVIIEEEKLLVVKDDDEDFYKLPGGTVDEAEGLEEACKREIREEIGGEIEIIKSLSPAVLWEHPQTKEKLALVLIHYLAKLLNRGGIKPLTPNQEVRWLSIEEIKQGKHNVAPNIKFLIEKGEI